MKTYKQFREEQENKPHYLYHYSSKPLDEILTPKTQVEKGIYNGDPEELNRYDTFSKEYKKTRPYSGHISLHIDPLPIDILKQHFPKESPYFRTNELYEHVIDLNKVDENTPWEIVETPTDNYMANHMFNQHLWDTADPYKKAYFSAKKLLNTMTTNIGEKKGSLLNKLPTYKNTIRQSFMNWTKSKHFGDESTKMYSASVPHVFLYPESGGVVPEKVNKITLSD